MLSQLPLPWPIFLNTSTEVSENCCQSSKSCRECYFQAKIKETYFTSNRCQVAWKISISKPVRQVINRLVNNTGGHSNPQRHRVKKLKGVSTWPCGWRLCLEGRVGHVSKGIVSLLRLPSRTSKTMGHFSSNPSPPSTGRTPASSQRHHCSANPVCLLLLGHWRSICFI